MRIALDTCVLLRTRDVRSPDHMLARGVMEWIVVHDIKSFVAPQVLAEYWAVATRPANQRGGLGLSIEAVQQDIRHPEELQHQMREPGGAP